MAVKAKPKMRVRCSGCRQYRKSAQRRLMAIPGLGQSALSHDPICGKCFSGLVKALNQAND